MGQAIARDLGLQQNEKEQQKLEKLERVVSEMTKKKGLANSSMSLQRSRFMSADEDDEEDFEEDEVEDDDDDLSLEDSNYGQKGVVSSESSRIDSHQQSNLFTQEPIKANPNVPYQRHFQSIKIDKFFINHNEEEEEEHEKEILIDISDEESGSPIQDQSNYNLQSAHERQKTNHNINHHDDQKINGQAHNIHQRNDSQQTNIKFQQQVLNKDFDFDIKSESESSQFGDVFSSGSDVEKGSHSDNIHSGVLSGKGEGDKSKQMDDENEENKLKNINKSQKKKKTNSAKSTGRSHEKKAITPPKSSSKHPPKLSSNNQLSPNTKPQQPQKENHDKPFFFPQAILQKQDSEKTQKYKKYLKEYFPDRKDN